MPRRSRILPPRFLQAMKKQPTEEQLEIQNRQIERLQDWRLGRFVLPLQALRGNWRQVAGTWMRGMCPVDIMHRFDTETVEVLAFHPDFEPIPNGTMAPEYVGESHQDLEGKLSVKWTRVELHPTKKRITL